MSEWITIRDRRVRSTHVPPVVHVRCPKCQIDLLAVDEIEKGPDTQFAHRYYFGADFGGWCVFRVRPEEVEALQKIAAAKP